MTHYYLIINMTIILFIFFRRFMLGFFYIPDNFVIEFLLLSDLTANRYTHKKTYVELRNTISIKKSEYFCIIDLQF